MNFLNRSRILLWGCYTNWYIFLECLNLNEFLGIFEFESILCRDKTLCTKSTVQVFEKLLNKANICNFQYWNTRIFQSLVYFLLFQATICPKCYLSTFWIQDASEFVENIYDLQTNGIRLHIRLIFFIFFLW